MIKNGWNKKANYKKRIIWIEKFDGLKFPTNGEIQRYFYIKDQSCHTEKPRNIAVKIYHEIENIYSKVPCSMKKKSLRKSFCHKGDIWKAFPLLWTD